MKKYLSGLIAAFLMSAGFVALSEIPASAACGGQYQPACVSTKTNAPGKVTTPANKAASVKVTIAANGNVKPSGTVTITIKPGGKTVEGKVKNGKVEVDLPKLKAGTYKLTIDFEPAASSNFKASSDKSTLTVKKAKKG